MIKGRVICTSKGHWAGPDNGAPTIEETAISLGKLCRYAGHCKGFYSVLIHSFVVDDLTKDSKAKIYSLTHDAGESVINDIPTPFKVSAMRELEARIYARILRDWDIPYPEKYIQAEVHKADCEALLGEIWTNGPPRLRELKQFKKRSQRAEKLVRFYQKRYPPSDTINSRGKAVREFILRFEKYKSQIEENK